MTTGRIGAIHVCVAIRSYQARAAASTLLIFRKSLPPDSLTLGFMRSLFADGVVIGETSRLILYATGTETITTRFSVNPVGRRGVDLGAIASGVPRSHLSRPASIDSDEEGARRMLLTITTTHRPAADLGYLLHKHPERFQSYDLSFGKAHVFYPEASDERCPACLLLDVDPVGIVRGKGSGEGLLCAVRQ